MFFTYNQNNSGGKWRYDAAAGISHFVIIEATSAAAANAEAESIGLYFDGAGDCSCCGNRWDRIDSGDGKDAPMIYAQPVAEYKPFLDIKWIDGFEAFVHYADGRLVGYCK